MGVGVAAARRRATEEVQEVEEVEEEIERKPGLCTLTHGKL